MRRVGQLLGWLAVVVLVTGCYILQPVTSAAGPEPGAYMGFLINDVGRLGLGGTMGPEIATVEGRLVSKTDDSYELAVSSVRLVRGGDQLWSGERVIIKKEFVSQVYERQFSKSRSIALAAVFVTGVSVFIWKNRALFGLGQQDPDTTLDTAEAFRPRFPRP